LLASFEQRFRVMTADTPDLLERVYRLRYQVYCIENAFEDPGAFPDGLETDAYDAASAHSLMVDRHTGAAMGAVRIVLPRPGAVDRSFPVQQVCNDRRLHDPNLLPLERMGEVSRFCISKDFRRRHQVGQAKLGLIRAAIAMTVANGLTHWAAAMEPWLLRLLRRLGIVFDPVGPPISYHGRRQPAMVALRPMLERVWRERPDVWMVITARGSLWLELCRLENRPAVLPDAGAIPVFGGLMATGAADRGADQPSPSEVAGRQAA